MVLERENRAAVNSKAMKPSVLGLESTRKKNGISGGVLADFPKIIRKGRLVRLSGPDLVIVIDTAQCSSKMRSGWLGRGPPRCAGWECGG